MKFNNIKKGRFKSTLEYTIRKGMPKVKGVKIQYETHKIPYLIPGNYLPDFVVSFPDGRIMYIEVKGYFRIEDRRKMAAVKNSNPHLDIRMVFPTKSKKNIKWCEKHGIPYAFGKVPKKWFMNENLSDR